MPTNSDFQTSLLKYKGVKYFEGNPQNPINGFDCSGIVQQALNDIGIHISRVTGTQAYEGKAVGNNTDLAQATPGDVLYYDGHCETWWGNGQVFSEATDGTVADVRGRTPWPIVAIRRFTDGPGSDIIGTGSAQADSVSNPVADALGLGGMVNDISSVGKALGSITTLFKFIADKHNWLRIAYFFLGMFMFTIAAWPLIKDSSVGKAAKPILKKTAEMAVLA